MADWLEEHGVELVVCAGYMQLLTPAFLERFPGRVVNVHPSLLPAFPGTHPIEDALAAGVARDRRYRPLRGRGRRHRPDDRARSACRSRPATTRTRFASACTPSSTGCCRASSGADRVIERALLSVYDKTGLDEFARGLAELGVELVASGGTAAYIEEHELGVTLVEELTGVGELLGGRVKTLHPRIHAAILARRDRPRTWPRSTSSTSGRSSSSCVNLYPFSQVAWRRGVGEEEAVEMIDVGGPAMLRAAAKNFAHVAPVCRPEQYAEVLTELRARGELSLDTRRRLAAEAFATTAAYESAIAGWFSEPGVVPGLAAAASFEKVLDLAYGENPHQRAAYYAEDGARRHVLSRVEQLQGKQLSFNNLNDLSAARLIARGVRRCRRA